MSALFTEFSKAHCSQIPSFRTFSCCLSAPPSSSFCCLLSQTLVLQSYNRIDQGLTTAHAPKAALANQLFSSSCFMRIQYTEALILVESLFVCCVNIGQNVSMPNRLFNRMFVRILRRQPDPMLTDTNWWQRRNIVTPCVLLTRHDSSHFFSPNVFFFPFQLPNFVSDF